MTLVFDGPIAVSIVTVLTLAGSWTLARWCWRHIPPKPQPSAGPSGECECGAAVSGDDLHVVTSVSADDDRLGIEGQTGMSADFCPDHCPGGCSRGCATIPR